MVRKWYRIIGDVSASSGRANGQDCYRRSIRGVRYLEGLTGGNAFEPPPANEELFDHLGVQVWIAHSAPRGGRPDWGTMLAFVSLTLHIVAPA